MPWKSSAEVVRFVIVVAVVAALAATGAAQTGGLLDSLNHAPPALLTFAYNAFALPSTIGASYFDPVFGTTVRRVTTDHSPDDIYARNMWWSADETRYLHRNPMGTAYADYLAVIDVATGAVTHNGIPIGTLPGDEGFDPVNPNVVYYHSGASIHQVTLNSNGTWTDAVYFTAPGGQTLQSLGATINWLDASGRFMVVRYGPEPSVYLYDRQNLAAGPYANPVDGSSTITRGSYVGITPDGKFLVGYRGADGSYGMYHMGEGVSWRIDHVNRSVGPLNVFWSLCGDHGTFISPSDGGDYMIASNCTSYAEFWRIDITNNAAGLTESAQRAQGANRLLMTWPTWNEVANHVSTVARGPLRDWAFYATEDSTDTYNSGSADGSGNISPWHAYRQEIVAFNVMTGQVQRLAHHRSRSVTANYYNTPRLSTSWGGKWVGWASNFNTSAIDIYAVQFASGSDATPPTVSVTAPAAGSVISGSTTLSATASDNVGVASVQFQLDGAIFGPQLTSAPYTTTWVPTSAQNGAHTLSAVASDAAGNVSTSAGVAVSVNIASTDTTPPVISGVGASNVSTTGATIAWTTNEGSDSQVSYGLSSSYTTSTALNATMTTTHSQALSGLTAGTLYHYAVKSRDAAGNLATSGDFTFTTTAASAPPPPPPSSSPGYVGYWPFNEGTGTATADASGNGNTGTLMNGPTWVAGKSGSALSFSGNKQYVAVSPSAAENAFPISIAAWVKVNRNPKGVRGIVNKYVASSYNGYQVFMNGANLCAWYLRDTANYVYDGSACSLSVSGYDDNKWHFVAFTVDASGGKLYVDGAQKKSLPWTGTPGAATTTQPLRVAHYPGAPGGAEYFAGSIDDVRLYSYGLSASDVTTLFGGGNVTPPPPSGPANIVWTQQVNVTVSGTTLTKTGGCDGCYDAGAVSQQQIASGNGYVQFTAPSAGLLYYIGLGGLNPSMDGTQLPFAIRIQATAEVREYGVYKTDTPLVAGDVFKISVESGAVKYYRNSVLFYTSTAAPSYPILGVAAMTAVNSSVTSGVINVGP